MENNIQIEIVNNEVIFRKDGEIVELNKLGQKALATAIIYHDMKKMFADPTFKDCDDRLLDNFNEVKKEYDSIKKQLKTDNDFIVVGLE